MDIHCIQELIEGGILVYLDFLILPVFKGKNMGLFTPNPLNLLIEMVHPLEVFQFFFQSGPTYHFCCMINTTTLRRTSKRNIRKGPPSVVLK